MGQSNAGTEILTHKILIVPLLLPCGVPQGSSLCPTSFLTYTEDTTDIFSIHLLLYHLYADDAQIYGHCHTSDISALVSRLTFCIGDLSKAYSSFQLRSTRQNKVYLVRCTMQP